MVMWKMAAETKVNVIEIVVGLLIWSGWIVGFVTAISDAVLATNNTMTILGLGVAGLIGVLLIPLGFAKHMRIF